MKTHDAEARPAQRQPASAAQAHDADATPAGAALEEGAVQGAMQAGIDRSPRMLMQRRALQVAFGTALQRRPHAEEGDAAPPTPTAPVNDTGLPNPLKAGIESLSGMDISDVRVHRNSGEPAQLNALAYAQGNEIHLGPGQEQHLPHEAWHVVQQRQGRVKATMQMAGVAVNDDAGLEREADAMGGKAAELGAASGQSTTPGPGGAAPHGSGSGAVSQLALQGASVAGAFTSIPSGAVTTTLKDWKILAEFKMEAKFSPDHTAAGRWGEFRQYIRGYFRTTEHASGKKTDLLHPLTPGEYLDESTWKEDGDANGAYGRRAKSAAGDLYTDLVDGSKYEGVDMPESDPVQPGNTLHMHLEFKGQLIDTGPGGSDNVLAESLWHIDKTRTRN